MSSLSIHGGVARKGPRTCDLSDIPLPVIQMCSGILFKMDGYSTFLSFFFFFFVREWFATRSHEYQPCKEELVCLKIIESFLSTSANITCTHDFKGWLPEFLVS